MRLFNLIFSAFYLVGSLAFAQEATEKQPTYILATCIVDAADPYAPDVRMNTGPLRDLCVNPTTRRSAYILSPLEFQNYFNETPGTVVIANFSHENKFWFAQIPLARVKTVTLQMQYFPVAKLPVVGEIDVTHTQMRFQFEEGTQILLKPQLRSTTLETPAVVLNEMVFSVENIGPYGEKFDAIKGMQQNYHIAYRAVSMQDKYNWMVVQQHHTVTQTRIKLDPEQVQNLLKLSLMRAHKYSTFRNYGTLGPNCSSELFNLLDTLLDIHGLNEPFYPNSAIHALEQRGLVDHSVSLPLLNEEFR